MYLHAFRRSLGRIHLLALAGLLTLLLAAWLVPLASAHNSLITVSAHCDSTVSYTATAWAGPTDASRTNTDVRVSGSSDNGRTWTQVGQGAFNKANGFSFSGVFSLGSNNSVRVRVQEVSNWGDGAHPAGPAYATATRPSACTTATTTTRTTTATTTTTTRTPTTTRTTTTTTTTPTPPPTTTSAPTTTAAPTTTSAPTTTAAPTTTSAPTATAAPTTTTTPTTTAGPVRSSLPPKRPNAVLGATATKIVVKKAKPKQVTAKAKPAKALAATAQFTG